MEMQPTAIPLDMGGAKLNRAREHFNDLSSVVRAFAEEYMESGISFKRDDETGDGVLDLFGVEPPVALGTLLGDCIQNQRSALDHAIHELSRRLQGDGWAGLGRSEFPIFTDAKTYRERGSTKIAGVTEPQRTFIESLQPYERGNGSDAATLDPLREDLALLHELSRIDKHRRLHVTVIVLTGATLTVTSHDGQVVVVPLVEGRPKSEAPPIASWHGERVIVGDATGEPTVDVRLDGRVTVGFKDGPAQGLGVVGIARRLDGMVEAILTALSE